MDKFMQAAALLPPDLKILCENCKWPFVEEIRLRVGKKPSVLVNGVEHVLHERVLSCRELESVLERACGASMHAHINEIQDGFINSKGLRIGFCAAAVYKEEKLVTFKNFSSVNIRIPGEFRGNIKEISNKLQVEKFKNTLIISPPGGGKTTLLRELIKQISETGQRISVVDERNELASFDGDKSYFDLGKSTDILVGVKKSIGAMMLLRGMTPQVIALDEISKREDLAAIYEIAGCGVEILATAHGTDLEQLKQRNVYRKLLEKNLFKNLITISSVEGERKYVYKRIAQ